MKTRGPFPLLGLARDSGADERMRLHGCLVLKRLACTEI